MKEEWEAEVWEEVTEKGSVYMQNTAAVVGLQEGHCQAGVWMVEEIFCV